MIVITSNDSPGRQHEQVPNKQLSSKTVSKRGSPNMNNRVHFIDNFNKES